MDLSSSVRSTKTTATATNAPNEELNLRHNSGTRRRRRSRRINLDDNNKPTTLRKTSRSAMMLMLAGRGKRQKRKELTGSRVAASSINKINRLIGTPSSALLVCALVLLAARLLHKAEAIKLQPVGAHKYFWSGEQFAITCQNTNNIKNVKIRWIGPNGLDVSEDKSAPVHAESTGPHSYRLMFMNATAKRDDGRYRCTIASADDRVARESMEFALDIHQSTSFRDTVRHLVLPAKRQGVIDCRVEFDPSVLPTSTVSWMRDGQAIEKFNDSNIRVNEWDQTRKSTQLILNHSDKRYDGTYTCRAIAETAHLSKISDHHIVVETIYPPTFEHTSETVWVERQQQQQSVAAGVSSQARAENGPQGHFSSRMKTLGRQMVGGEQPAAAGDQQQVIRVELNCNCQANPNASILWSLASSRFVLSKGEPEHIVDLTPTHIDGHNSTSTLVISYNLDPNWRYKADSYICSATNQLGSAQKVFTVEQGDPPPAFHVGSQRHYDPLTYQFKFQLLGPNFDASGPERDIKPPVDALRIRAESALGVQPAVTAARYRPAGGADNVARRRFNEPSVQLNLPTTTTLTPNQTFAVNLSKLPSGPQRLYLETHNAVGWSPNATYLGEYNIVNGISSSPLAAASIGLGQYLQLLVLSLAASLLISSATKRNHNYN